MARADRTEIAPAGSSRAWAVAAWAAAVPALAIPVTDPDLWWHLSAGRWIAARFSLPSADWLSWTMADRPWTDFEWLPQVLFYAVHRVAGLGGLWLVKTALLAACAWSAVSLAGRLKASFPARAVGLALWAAALLPRADARPELFSLLAFSALLRALETRRRALSDRSRALLSPAAAAAFFSLWACSHAGFAYGLALLAAYAAEEWARARRAPLLPVLAAAAAGTLLNPYGWEVHAVMARHLADRSTLSVLDEWRALDLAPEHWAAWALAAASLWALKRRPRSSALVACALAAAAVLHVRFVPYLACAAVPLALPALPARRGACAAVLAGLLALSVYNGARAGFPRRLWSGRLVCERAASFLERRPGVAALPAYNPWGWGGYLAWRLGMRVFQDGRYMFHPLLEEAARAARTPGSWQAFLAGRGVDLALLENVPLTLPSERVYPDGSRRSFERPYYAQYMPKERWALVHFDARALVFVRRGALPEAALAGMEYRWLRPRDEAALEDARARGEVDEAALERERLRKASDDATR